MNIPENYRLDCLRLAHGAENPINPAPAVVDRAKTYYAFVSGLDEPEKDGEDKLSATFVAAKDDDEDTPASAESERIREPINLSDR